MKAIYGLLIIIENGRVIWSRPCVENALYAFPDGCYDLRLEHSPKFNRDLYELYGVPGRKEIKIHTANSYKELEGCIAPGLGWADIDKDGYIDVTSSGPTVDDFIKAMGGIKTTYIRVTTLT